MRPLLPALLLAFAVLASACSLVDEQLDRVQEGAGDAAETAQFCFAVTRALTAIDGGSSPAEARDAAEEVLTQAPEELRDDAEVVAEHLRRAEEQGDAGVLDDPEFREAAERLRERTRQRCDLTG